MTTSETLRQMREKKLGIKPTKREPETKPAKKPLKRATKRA